TNGNAIGSRIISGKARIVASPREGDKINEGDIIVTDVTSPDWDPILKRCAATITNEGGRNSHASIVARELDVPAIVGCGNATEVIADGDLITVSCCEGKTGYVYKGVLAFKENEYDFSKLRKPEFTEVMMIVGDPDKAFKLSFYP